MRAERMRISDADAGDTGDTRSVCVVEISNAISVLKNEALIELFNTLCSNFPFSNDQKAFFYNKFNKL
jgi:hypothetical protein